MGIITEFSGIDFSYLFGGRYAACRSSQAFAAAHLHVTPVAPWFGAVVWRTLLKCANNIIKIMEYVGNMWNKIMV